MKQIAVLIPTYKRSHKLEELVDNFYKCSKEASLYFIIEPDDVETLKVLNGLYSKHQFSIFTINAEYVKAINEGVSLTSEPYIFCGADDILFTPKWDIKLLKVMEDESVNVTGGIDDWICSKSGIHISHPLVRRSYIEGIGSYWGGNKGLYFEGYNHYQCDIELEQLAWTRNCFRLCREVTIHHNHYINKKANDDETYQKSRKNLKADTDLYEERSRAFEYWDIFNLHNGCAKESVYFRKRLSVIMPIWNCEKYVRSTLDSLIRQTKHKYELIMIDDRSTEFDGLELLTELKEIALSGGFTNVIIETNDEQKYTNANWNRGLELATGNYIAVINSDIDFLTEEWDDYLIENIDLGYDISSPFQLDRIYPEKAYMLPKFPDVCSRQKLRGACFMLSKKYAKNIFPIPDRYTHWVGDDFIGNNADTWIFDIRVSIFHYISKSGEKVDQKKFWKIVLKDCVNYQEDTGVDMSQIISNCQKRLHNL